MLAQTSDFQKKFSYHHGGLRGALIDAALEILGRDGAAGLSLRGLARATGVTPAAPYSHFRDKDELLAAVAEAGFQRLALRMAEAATGKRGAAARIESLMTAYIRFALDNKPLFRLMFSPELAAMKNYPTLAMTAGKSYALLAAALAPAAPSAEEGRLSALALWSLCHGVTTLVADDKIRPEQFGAATLEAFVQRLAGTLRTF